MKISVVTVCYNSENYIGTALESISSQTFMDLELIIVDGASTDQTVSIIREYEPLFGDKLKWTSEPDMGLYDAMNKGIRMASGDIIGMLNSDDFFFDQNVLEKVAKAFVEPDLKAIIGDIVFIKDVDHSKIARHYSARNWQPAKFAWGYMPPHPSFFVRREYFEKLGYYKIDYKIAADYELLIRFLLNNKINWKYLPLITTKMRMGGASTKGLKSLITLNQEIYRACGENGVYTNYAMIYSKYLFKPFEFIFK